MRFVPALADIVPYVPGLPIEIVMRRYGLSEVVKLASNEFPLPPFDEVKRVIIEALDDLNRYPDGDATDLRAALAAHYGCVAEQIAVGSGSCELLMLLGDALLEKGDEVVFAHPSFVVYNDVCRLHEARAVAVPLVDFTHDLEAMAAAVTPHTKMVLVCNPNNPTGTYVPVADIARLVEAVPGDVLVVVDEAYNEFVTATDSQDALKHQDQVARRREVNAELRADMVEQLAAQGRATVPSQANFMLVNTCDLCQPQDQVCQSLLSMGAIVRDGNALGCPGWARVSVGTQNEIEFFLRRLASLEVGAPGEGEGRPS